MPVFDIPKQYSNGNDLYEEHLDAAFEYIEGALNTTKLDNNNIQTGGVATANIADNAVTTAKINQLAVTTTKIDDAAVTAAKLATDAVETAKIKDANVTAAKLATDSVETAKIKDSNVTTAKIANGAVTKTKLSAANYGINDTAGTAVSLDLPISGASVSINVTGGRPVELSFLPSGDGTTKGLASMVMLPHPSNGSNGTLDISFYRDSTCIGIASMGVNSLDTFNGEGATAPITSFKCVDIPPVAATHTYTANAKTSATQGSVIAASLSPARFYVIEK